MFQEKGYSCGLSGKLHLSACHFTVCNTMERRIDDGYDIFSWSHHPAAPDNKHNWVGNEYTWFLRENGITQSPQKREDCPYVEVGYPQEYNQSTWCTNKAIEFMDASQALDKPFFYTANYYDPHHPFDPPPQLMEKYMARLDDIPLPNYKEGELDTKSMYARKDHNGAYDTPGNYPFPAMSDKDHKMLRASYYAMMELLDQNIGRLLDYLDAHNLMEDTIIIFNSDHGELLGDHGMYLKGPYFYECSVHVPYIMAWKGKIAAGATRHALVEQTDIVPTLLELCGWEIEPQIQGRSFAGLMQNNAQDSHRPYVYCEYYNSNINHRDPFAYMTMICDGKHKLVRIHNNKHDDDIEGELYDLEKDPTETVNRYHDSSYADVKLRLFEYMTDSMAYTCDPLPLRRSPW